jgi:hypothetical protein
MKERDIINEALVYSSKDMQNAFEAGVKSIKDKLPSLEQAAVDHGAKIMAKQIRKSIEDNLGVFGDEIDEKGNVIQSDANWILQRFREIPSLEGIDHVEKCIVCAGSGEREFYPCIKCIGTVEITRPAEWVDIDVQEMIEARSIPDYRTKSGGRLRVREKD